MGDILSAMKQGELRNLWNKWRFTAGKIIKRTGDFPGMFDFPGIGGYRMWYNNYDIHYN